jgi:tRNA G18 (ribose-2'-O)-methylase SpoU
MLEHVSSIDDARIDDYRGVSDPELLRSRGLFVAEGRLVVSRVLDDGRWTVRSVLVNEAARRELAERLSRLDASVPVLICEPTIFREVTGYHIHRGCLALVERPPALTLRDAIADARLVVVLDGVANADNVGGVFRNAAAFSVDVVVLSPTCCSPLYRKAVRTSMAAALRVPFVHLDAQWPDALPSLRANGFALVALTPREPSETLAAFAGRPALPPKLALIIGSEGPGLTAEVERSADYRVRIPIAPGVDSLNLAVAAGIALEQLMRVPLGRGILAGRTEPAT